MSNEAHYHQELMDKLNEIVTSLNVSTEALAQSFNRSLDLEIIANVNVDKHHENNLRRKLFPTIEQFLNSNDYCSGAGFASHFKATNEQRPFWFLEWWFKNSQKQRSCLKLSQTTQQRLDFSTFEWFKLASSEQGCYVHGPYVDYICNSSYTLTAAAPVVIKGKNLGVAAVDILVSTLESELLPIINRSARQWVVTNLEQRVVISTSSHFRVGTLLPHDASADHWPVKQLILHVL